MCDFVAQNINKCKEIYQSHDDIVYLYVSSANKKVQCAPKYTPSVECYKCMGVQLSETHRCVISCFISSVVDVQISIRSLLIQSYNFSNGIYRT